MREEDRRALARLAQRLTGNTHQPFKAYGHLRLVKDGDKTPDQIAAEQAGPPLPREVIENVEDMLREAGFSEAFIYGGEGTREDEAVIEKMLQDTGDSPE